MTKEWWKSKTLWFNVLALIAAVASGFGYTGELPEEWAVYVPAIIALSNMALRWVTNTGISIKN